MGTGKVTYAPADELTSAEAFSVERFEGLRLALILDSAVADMIGRELARACPLPSRPADETEVALVGDPASEPVLEWPPRPRPPPRLFEGIFTGGRFVVAEPPLLPPLPGLWAF